MNKPQFVILDLELKGIKERYVIVKNIPPVSLPDLVNFLNEQQLDMGDRDDLENIQDYIAQQERINYLIADNNADRPLVAPGAPLEAFPGMPTQYYQLIGTKILLTRKRRSNWPPYTHFLAKRKI